MRRFVIGKKADVQGAPDAAEAAADVTVKWNRQRNLSKKAEGKVWYQQSVTS